jgi:hypothetical protein
MVSLAIQLNLYRMKKNMGTIDRVARLIIAAIFLIGYFTNAVTGTLGILLLILAVVFAITSFVSFCPLYLPFGISTNKKTNSH